EGLNRYMGSRGGAEAVKVLLSGTGSDEVFAGYPWFASMAATEKGRTPARGVGFAALWRLLGRGSDDPAHGNGRKAFLERYGGLNQCLGPDSAASLLDGASRDATVGRVPVWQDLASLDELPAAPLLDRVSVLCLNGYTRNQLLRDIDACSMSHSLEVRVPFLDPLVADFALSLPDTAKLHPA